MVSFDDSVSLGHVGNDCHDNDDEFYDNGCKLGFFDVCDADNYDCDFEEFERAAALEIQCNAASCDMGVACIVDLYADVLQNNLVDLVGAQHNLQLDHGVGAQVDQGVGASAIVLGVGAAVGENHKLQLDQDVVAVVLEVGAVVVGVVAEIIDVGAVEIENHKLHVDQDAVSVALEVGAVSRPNFEIWAWQADRVDISLDNLLNEMALEMCCRLDKPIVRFFVQCNGSRKSDPEVLPISCFIDDDAFEHVSLSQEHLRHGPFKQIVWGMGLPLPMTMLTKTTSLKIT